MPRAGYLPDKVVRVVEKRMRATYRNPDPLAGPGDLEALAREIEHAHPALRVPCAKDWP